MVIKTLTKWPDDFHPALVKAIVKGEDAVFELALRSSGELEGQMMPWKKISPI